MRLGSVLLPAGVLAAAVIGAAATPAQQGRATTRRPQGPCDIYAAAGTPCVAAHSTTRALSAAYDGPLYRVTRTSDGRTLDIGVAASGGAPDANGYADAAAQDAFCARAICVIDRIYDQSGKGNHLYQAPPGPLFPGPAKGAFDTQPIADMAPITIGGHKAYGVFIMPGMGFRNNDARDIAIDDEPEGIYYVIDGTHYDSGCCFDYGNASTNGRAVGTGTMETTYFGTATAWGRGSGPGPWIMADMEAGLFSGYDAKENAGDPTIDRWRFVTAVVNGGGGNRWDLRGGDAQAGRLTTFYSGVRPGSRTDNRYYPMHKQGAILLGTGGDNGNGSSGTFYEGVMTAGYPTDAAIDAVQANIVAARYDVRRVDLSRVTTFTPRSAQKVEVTFTNTTGAAVPGVALSLSAPSGWQVTADGATGASRRFTETIAAGARVSATFSVTSRAAASAGWLTGQAEWTDATSRGARTDTATSRVRNAFAVKINEVRLAGDTPTDQFIELYNASSATVDLSNWRLINTASQWAPTTLATIPRGTRLAPGAFFVLGLAGSGLAAPAASGATTIHVRSTTGLAAGTRIDVDGEIRTVSAVGTPAAPATTVFIPVSTGPWIAIPAGSTRLPVTTIDGFAAGDKVAIGAGATYEITTVTSVGKPATQTTLSAAVAAGGTTITLTASGALTAGDTLTIGTGARKETVRIARVSADEVTLAAPLTRDHRQGLDVSAEGTGLGVSPATRYAHTSGDAVRALGSGITLDRALTMNHPDGAPVRDPQSMAEGFQEPPAPSQWFGGPLSSRAGSIALMDASGAVLVDAVVYGSQQSNSSGNGTIASPEIATLEGDQRQGGCIAVVPTQGRGANPAALNRSIGRFPDGADRDRLCADFHLQTATTMAAAAAAGATTIKVASVADFMAGQPLTIGRGASLETATIATVGTAGATTASAAAAAGATVIPVSSPFGFAPNQAITIDAGENQETAVVASFGRGGRGRGGAGPSLTLAAPLTRSHAAGAQISGTGITLTAPLTRAHESGSQVATDLPTPGAPNRYARR